MSVILPVTTSQTTERENSAKLAIHGTNIDGRQWRPTVLARVSTFVSRQCRLMCRGLHTTLPQHLNNYSMYDKPKMT